MTGHGGAVIIPPAMIRLLLIPFLLAAPAFADDCRGPEGLEPAVTTVAAVDGEFRFVAGKLGCAVPEMEALEMARRRLPLTYVGCLKVGRVAVSDSMDDVEEMLGPPERILRLSETVETRAYFVGAPALARPHYAVTYRRGDVVAVQLIGPPAAEDLAFSSLHLGDRQARVIELFGLPVKRCPGPKGAETWMWPPFPMGVDIADGIVTGMKVSWPSR